MGRMKKNKRYQFLQGLQADFNRVLLKLTSLPSYTGEKTQINVFLDEVERLFSEFRPEAVRIPGEKGDILQMRLFPGKPGKVVLLAHADTVRVDGGSPRIDEATGRLYANGAFDMKAGIALFYFALRSLATEAVDPAMAVHLILTPDEEVGSPFSHDHLLDLCRDAGTVLLPEPCCPNGGVKLKRKAITAVDAFFEGRAAHSGIAPEEGRDANRALARTILRIDEIVARFPCMTFNPGVLGGGTRTNIVSANSFLQGEIRTYANSDMKATMEQIADLQEVDGVTAHIQCRLLHPAMEANPASTALYEKAKRIMAEIDYSLPTGESGGASDGSTLAAAGIPVLDGIGMKGGNAHAREEYVELADFASRAYLVSRLLEEIEA